MIENSRPIRFKYSRMLCYNSWPLCAYVQLLPLVTLLMYAKTPPAVACLTMTKNTLKACRGCRLRFKDRAIYNSLTSTDGAQYTVLDARASRWLTLRLAHGTTGVQAVLIAPCTSHYHGCVSFSHRLKSGCLTGNTAISLWANNKSILVF